MLTDLQRRVRSIVASLPEGAALALAGGSALIVTGVVHRGTDDLDFFAAHPQPVAPMLDYDELVAFAKSTARELQELERERNDPGGLSII